MSDSPAAPSFRSIKRVRGSFVKNTTIPSFIFSFSSDYNLLASKSKVVPDNLRLTILKKKVCLRPSQSIKSKGLIALSQQTLQFPITFRPKEHRQAQKSQKKRLL